MTATQFLALEREFCSDGYFKFHGIEALRRKIRSMERFLKECRNWIDRDTVGCLRNRLVDARAELKAREDLTNPCRNCPSYSVVWYFDNVEEYRNCKDEWAASPSRCPRASEVRESKAG